MIVLAVSFGAGLVGFFVGWRRGRTVGQVALWDRLLTDRRLGHAALEKLAEAHRAKLELHEAA